MPAFSPPCPTSNWSAWRTSTPRRPRPSPNGRHAQAYTHFGPLLDRVDAACIVVPTSQHHAVASRVPRTRHAAADRETARADRRTGRGALSTWPGRRRRASRSATSSDSIPRSKHLAAEADPAEVRRVRAARPVHRPIDGHRGRARPHGARSGLDRRAGRHAGRQTWKRWASRSSAATKTCVNARLRFASGCVADVTACRIARCRSGRMQVWSPDAVATIDFASRRLTVVTPSDALRAGPRIRAMEVGLHNALKNDLFGKHLQIDESVCEARHDQLTCEIKHFIQCATTSSQPRSQGPTKGATS